MKWPTQLLFCICLLSIANCSPPEVDQRFHFDNQTNGALTIELIGSQIDTLINIPFGQKRSFIIPDSVRHNRSEVEVPIETHFDAIIITNQENETSQRDYLDDDNWEFVKSDESDYFTTISDDEF